MESNWLDPEYRSSLLQKLPYPLSYLLQNYFKLGTRRKATR